MQNNFHISYTNYAESEDDIKGGAQKKRKERHETSSVYLFH